MFNLIYLETVDSTNLFAKRHLEEFPKAQMTIIYTSYQTLGLGTNERRWLSEKGENILATYCFPKSAKTLPHQYTQCMAIAARSTLSKFGVDATIKWPNDLLVRHKKIAGIKAELVDHPLFILGIGLNVNLKEGATSIFLETKKSYPVKEVLDSLSNDFSYFLSILHQKGFPSLLPLYREVIELYDNALVTSNEGIGYLRSITEEGYLVLEDLNGHAKTIKSGSVRKCES